MSTLRGWFSTAPRVQLPATGAWLSTTVTVKLHVAVLPLASVARQLTVVLPIGKVEPEAGVQTGVKVPEHRSLAVVLKLTAVPSVLVVNTVMSGEQVIVGGGTSRTVTVAVALAELPLLSVTVTGTMLGPSLPQ